MFRATGEAKYVDVLENALYNAVLSGISLEGTNYFYVNPLRQVNPLPTKLRWSRQRVPFVTSYCCPPNVLRTIAEIGGYAYSKTDDAIWINLYGSNRLSTRMGGQSLKISQETTYPWDGAIKITIDECPSARFSIKLRIPGWVEGASVEIYGGPAKVPIKPSTYVELDRKWKSGEVVNLRLPMPARLIEANPLVEETRNQAAVKRGPIVYCLESTDLPKDIRVQDAAIRARAKLPAHFEPGLLNGVAVVDAEIVANASGDWDGKLYRPREEGVGRNLQVHLIPYYAWANRGVSEMSVWLPVK
jgi:DUF1680 family protein